MCVSQILFHIPLFKLLNRSYNFTSANAMTVNIYNAWKQLPTIMENLILKLFLKTN